MKTLIDFAIRTEYDKIKPLVDNLCEIGSQIDWKRFRFLEPLIYKNKRGRGGRPNIDIVIMVKLLVLQHWYGLSDPELERQVADRISFRIFIGTTEVVPDFSTVWLFRERLIKGNTYEKLWDELQRQIEEKGFLVKSGTIQDATFITSDPGQKRKQNNQKDLNNKNENLSATSSELDVEFDKELLLIANNAETIINGETKSKEYGIKPINEGEWAKKGNKSFFGYKGHILIDTEHRIIRKISTTAASVHDSQVDLGIEDKPRYGDKGYDGAKTIGYNAAMKKASRGHKLGIKDILRNKRISQKRSRIERCFAVMKCIHNAGHVSVTTVARAGIKFMMDAMVYNIDQLRYLAKVERS